MLWGAKGSECKTEWGGKLLWPHPFPIPLSNPHPLQRALGLCEPKEEEEEQGEGEVGGDRSLAAWRGKDSARTGWGPSSTGPAGSVVPGTGQWPGTLDTDLPAGAGVPQEVVPGHQAVPQADAGVAHAAVAAGDGHAGGGRARGHGADAGVLRARLVGRLATRATEHRAGAQVVFTGVPRAAAALHAGGTDKTASSPCQSILCTLRMAAAAASPRRALHIRP